MNKTSIILRKIACVILLLALGISSLSLVGCGGEDNVPDSKVLLISIDGMRSDAAATSSYGRFLTESTLYSLDMQTVFPSVTLPCHMSMFHSVTPEAHGVTDNVYTLSEYLGLGITEALAAAGKTSAVFYNWEPMGNIVTEGSCVKKEYIGGEIYGWEEANEMLASACIEYLSASADSTPDFTYLYLGFLDEWGHRYGWLSDEYNYALERSFLLINQVMSVLPEGYTVIITADHGGHGNGHGTVLAEDMTIPVFILGDGISPAKLPSGKSILDIAPTVLDILGVSAPDYWQGKSLIPKVK